MAWIVTSVVGGALLGAQQAAAQRKAQQQANQQNANINAAQMQYSPWTGVKPGAVQMGAVNNNEFGGAAQGALGGAMFGKQLSAGMPESKFAPGDNPADPNYNPYDKMNGSYKGPR